MEESVGIVDMGLGGFRVSVLGEARVLYFGRYLRVELSVFTVGVGIFL